MRRWIENDPGQSFTVHEELAPGMFKMWRVVKLKDHYSIRHIMNDAVNGHFSVRSSGSYDSAEEAISALKKALGIEAEAS